MRAYEKRGPKAAPLCLYLPQKLRRFLADGDKAKVTLRYRGREMAHQQLGAQIMDRIRADLAEEAQIEQNPKMEGRQMIMVLAPKKKK